MSLKPAADVLVSIVISLIVFFMDGFIFPALFNARSTFYNIISYFLVGLTFLLAGGWVASLIYRYSWRQRMKKYFEDLQ